MQRFTELRVWHRSHSMALDVYRLTSQFPPSEQFGLTSQLRRAIVSVSCNIAEGAKRESDGEYAHLLNIAEGSLAEAECLLRLSRDLEFAPSSAANRLIQESEEVSRMICALRSRVEARRNSRVRRENAADRPKR